MSVFSPQTVLYIKKQHVLQAAADIFFREWSDILTEVRRRFSRDGYLCNPIGKPSDCLQLHRQDWPGGQCQVHYEVLCSREFLIQGIVDLSLHVEHDTPNQAAVCSRLRSLLHPHSKRIYSLLSPYAPRMPDLPIQDIVKAQLPLEGVTPEAIGQAIDAMMQAESFVDEALFLAGTRTVWRTDFSVSDPPIEPNWFGNDSSQRIVPQAGGFGSACWRMDGSVPNARSDHSERGVICLLVTNDMKDLIHNRGRYRICDVVKSRKPAQLTIRGEGHVYDPEGGDIAWPMAFRTRQQLVEVDRWRYITWEVTVPPAEEVTGWFAMECGGDKRSIPFDFGKQGIWIVLNVETEDPQFLMDSIEIARVWEGSNE